MSLIGYNGFAGKIAQRIELCLSSPKPYTGFSVRGARRSGRSTLFTKISEELCGNGQANCFVGELTEATRKNFEATLLNAISNSALCSDDYGEYQGNVQSVEGFFGLCAALNQNESKPPVFLIDMGLALGKAYEDGGMDRVNDITRLLRQIFNSIAEKNIKLILAIGLTEDFVRAVINFSQDVYIDRYKNEFSLTNTNFDGESSDSFRQIVSSISGLEIPDTYPGLWRGTTITAGQFGENLKSRGTTTVSGEILWQNLHGQWPIIEEIRHSEIPGSDLADLLLADAVISENRYPQWLEACDDGFRATDDLYQEFGLLSPQKDPSKQERINRRVDDPDDDDIARDLLTGLSEYLQRLGVCQLQEAQNLGAKSALLEAQLDSHPDPNLSDLERELTVSAFPKKLLVASVLTGDPAEEDLKQAMEKCDAEQGFLLILLKEGLDFGRTPLGRRLIGKVKGVEKIPHRIQLISTEEEIAKLLAEELDGSLTSEVSEWISEAVDARLKVHPPLSVSHSIIKNIVNGTINGGVLDIARFAEQHDVTQADAKKCLKCLTTPPILTLKKSQVVWDPDKDVVLKALMEHQTDEEALIKEISKHYTVSHVDPQALADLYEVVTGGEGLEALTEEKIIEHTKAIHSHDLRIIKTILDEEKDLSPELGENFEAYRDRSLEDLSEIAPFTEDIIALKVEVESAKEKIIERKEQIQQEIRDKKEETRNLLEEGRQYFTPEEKDEMLSTIEGIRQLNSVSFRQIKNRINGRVKLVEDANKTITSYKNRLEELGDTVPQERYDQIEVQLDGVEKLIGALDLDGMKGSLQEVEGILIEDEEKKNQQAILRRARSVEVAPHASGGGGEPPPMEPVTSGTSEPPPMEPVTSGTSEPPPMEPVTSGTSGPPPMEPVASGKSGPPPMEPGGDAEGDPVLVVSPSKEPQKFDLSDPEQRKGLVELLVQNHNTGSIKKIEIHLNE
ncbi:hypothetical protein N8703_02855 [Verrucomicrobia bacterium]|nr:hypothetical protein [Verrucomicrobiota bacterium]